MITAPDETPSICDICETSSHCSQLRLALAILGEALDHSPSSDVATRYRKILQELAAFGWNYPHSQSLCQLSDKETLVKALTDELIRLARTEALAIPAWDQAAGGTAVPPKDQQQRLQSLYEEETSCE